MPDERPETHPGRPADRIVVDLAVRLGFLGLFAWLALAILSPFVLILLWALFLTVALQPGHARLAARLGGRGRLAAVIVTLIGLAIVLGPISMLVASLVGSVETLSMGMAGGGLSIPPPPAEVKTIPIAGAWLHSNWELASSNLQGFLGRYGTTLIGAGKWVIRPAEALGRDLIDILIAVVVAGVLLVPGPRFVPGFRRFAARIMGSRGSDFVDLGAATIRNVARGVIGVAAIQALFVGVALIAAGVPAAGLLTLVALLGAILQIGVGIVAVPVIVWGWIALGTLPAILLTAWLVPAMFSDLALKPLMVGHGLRTPMLVILTGVIGGTISFGLIGLFLGPIVLALFYELVIFWVELGEPGEDAAAAGGGTDRVGPGDGEPR